MPESNNIPEDMVSAIEEFSREAEEIVGAFTRRVAAQPPPSRIYHYTSDEGLRGILQSGRLWLTDIFSLNDPSELRHGFSPVINALSAKAASGPAEAKSFADRFERFAIRGGVEASAHYFVCSFSASGDDLGQWRAYADNARGFALGFDADVLERSFAGGSSNTSTFPLAYSGTELQEIHRGLVDRMFSLISLPRGRNLGSGTLTEYLKSLSVALTLPALHAALFFKHEAYSNEKEYRFLRIDSVGAPSGNVKYRSRPHSLIPYCEFDWRVVAESALTEILVGPADQDKALRFVRDCLRAFHRGSVTLTRSTIPYRAP